jgi:8-oxo-dGTP pyrophosphatase MutT (NUDIX family)
MSHPPRWKTLDFEVLERCRVFNVGRKRVRSPRTGDDHFFYTIGAGDWVNVVPVTPDDQIVMVRQYRHGCEEITLEIPGGMVDAGESPAEAAARELLEETGYRAREVSPLGVVNPNPALFANRCYTFLAKDAEKVSEIQNDGGSEETAVELVPRAELHDRLRAGHIDHALVVAAFMWLELG